jgi:hypothetical protein
MLLLSFHCNSQENSTLERAIGVSCFFSGAPTSVVSEFYTYIDASNYEKIESEIFSKKPENKVMALFILEVLEELEIHTLSQEAKEEIMLIKNSEDEILLCSGCISLRKTSIKDFFSTNNYHLMLSIKNRLENSK